MAGRLPSLVASAAVLVALAVFAAANGSGGHADRRRCVSTARCKLFEHRIDSFDGIVLALTFIDDKPAVVFANGHNLYFARAKDARGRHWNVPDLIAANVNPLVGGVAIEIVRDRPVVSFFNATEGALTPREPPGINTLEPLLFVAARDRLGRSWRRPVIAFDGVFNYPDAGDRPGRGYRLSMAIVHKRVALCFSLAIFNITARVPNPIVTGCVYGRLGRYGADFQPFEVVWGPQELNLFVGDVASSVANVHSRFGVAYATGIKGSGTLAPTASLRYRLTNKTSSDVGSPGTFEVLVDHHPAILRVEPGDTGAFPFLTLVRDRPAISYTEPASDPPTAKVALSKDYFGHEWTNHTAVVDVWVNVPTSLAGICDRPFITFGRQPPTSLSGAPPAAYSLLVAGANDSHGNPNGTWHTFPVDVAISNTPIVPRAFGVAAFAYTASPTALRSAFAAFVEVECERRHH